MENTLNVNDYKFHKPDQEITKTDWRTDSCKI